MGRYHPDLAAARWIPPFSYGSRLAAFMRRMTPRGTDPGPDVTVEEVRVGPTVSLRMFRLAGAPAAPVPVLLWMHGGGHLFGSPEQDDQANIALVRELGVIVAAARYRLGGDAPAPASVDDCYLALKHLHTHADELGVAPRRIAVGGASAGGGVAAGLVLYAHDLGEVPVAFQLLVYPMLDDRTVTRANSPKGVRMWTPQSNRLGWATYLGTAPGGPGVSAYAAPSRREDLSGLPPTWIGVGTVDLFHDEDVALAHRLRASDVPCELVLVPGAFHGFDQLFAKKPVVRDFRRAQADALRRAGIVA